MVRRGRTGLSGGVVLLLLLSTAAFGIGGIALGAGGPAHAPISTTPADHSGPAHSVLAGLARPAGNGSAPPSWYCPGGTAAQVSSASQRFDLCTWIFSRSPSFQVGYYANATLLGGSNVSGNYSWSFSFGDGSTASQSSPYNLTGSYLHAYTANGTYSFVGAVTDTLGSLNVSIPISVTLNISAMSIALSSYQTTTANGSATTYFSCGITGGVPTYDFQYSFGDGTYYLDNTSTSTGSCDTTHTYGPVASATTYSVHVRAWDGSGHNASASTSVTPSYNYNNSSGGSGGTTFCGGTLGSGPNATEGSSASEFVTTSNYDRWYLYAWAPHLNVSFNSTLSIGNTSAVVDLGGMATTAVSPACLIVSWGDGSPVYNHSLPAAGGSSVSLTHSYNGSGYYNVQVAISNGTVGAVTNFSFRLNFSGSSGGSTGGGGGGGGNNSSSGSVVSQLVSSSNRDVWLVQEWVPGDYVNTTVNLTIANASAALTLSTAISVHATPWFLVAYFSPGGSWSANGSSNGTYSFAPVTQWYNTSGVYSFSEGLTQGSANAGANFSFALNFSSGSSGGSGAYPTAVGVSVGAAPVTGAAPLTVVLSAFIDGGSAPFVVLWSLPGSSTPNASGLMVTTTYNLSGWYPATAFVYNTTSSYGTVLVGYGSVWLYATGNASGGGSSGGNHSGNRSGDTKLPGAADTGAAPPPAMSLTVALLAAVLTGGVAGGVAGFVVGQHKGSKPRRSGSPPAVGPGARE